jgi:uncharacterized protein YbjT (DUF2867 family)
VRHLVVLSQLGADEDSPVRFLRYHGAVERHVRALGLPSTFLRPNLYFQGMLAFAGLIAATGRFAASLRGILPPWQVDGLREDYGHYRRGEASAVSAAVPEVTGRPATSFPQFARDYARAFSS